MALQPAIETSDAVQDVATAVTSAFTGGTLIEAAAPQSAAPPPAQSSAASESVSVAAPALTGVGSTPT